MKNIVAITSTLNSITTVVVVFVVVEVFLYDYLLNSAL
jgi:hypothetical protein